MKIIALFNKYISFDLLPLYIVSILMPLAIYGKAVNVETKWGTYMVLFMLTHMIMNNLVSPKSFVRPSMTIKGIMAFSFIAGISCFNLFFTNIDHPFYLAMYSLLPYVLICYLYQACERNSKVYDYLIAYSFILLVLGFYRYFRQEAVLDIIGRQQSSSNAFYFALMPLPCVLLIKNNWIKVIALALVTTVCIMSLKRTALIVMFIVIFMMVYQNLKANKKMVLLIVVVLIGGIYKLGDIMFEKIDAIMFRMENLIEDGGSGRSDIYHTFLTQDINKIYSFPELLIGNGYRSFMRAHNNILEAVHNDYLEFTYAYGISGFIFMVWFLFRQIKNIKYLKYYDLSFRNAYWCYLLLFVLYSMTGGIFSFIYSAMPLFIFIAVVEHKFKKDADN